MITEYFRFQFKDLQEREKFWKHVKYSPDYETVCLINNEDDLNDKFEEMLLKRWKELNG
jgi:hypothetical protein